MSADLSGLTADVIAAETDAGPGRAAAELSDDDRTKLHGETMTLRQGLAMGGGALTFGVLLLLTTFDQLGVAAMNVLGPDIGRALGVSDGVVVFMVSASAAFVVLGIVPMGWLADRYPRGPIAAASAFCFGIMALLSGLAVNAFMLFWARFGSGVAQASTIPVNSSLLADTYPIGMASAAAWPRPRRPSGASQGWRARSSSGSSPRRAGAPSTAAGGGRSSSSARR
jgi:hypothetical protein